MDTNVKVAIITGVFGLLTGLLTSYIKPIKHNNKNTKLMDHEVFSRIEGICEDIEWNFTLLNKGKEKIFKDILKNQLTIIKEHLLKIAKQVDNSSIKNDNQLYNENILCFNDILSQLRTYYKNNDNYSEEDQKVLDIVMKIYEAWNKSELDHIKESIEMTCHSSFYNTIEIKTAIIFDRYISFAEDTLIDAQKTLNKLNGNLKGLKFKNTIL